MNPEQNQPSLVRGFGLLESTAANMLNMIGVGPFLTIPLALAAMGGPQAMLGWIVGAGIAVCDGLVWAELGAALVRGIDDGLEAGEIAHAGVPAPCGVQCAWRNSRMRSAASTHCATPGTSEMRTRPAPGLPAAPPRPR